MTRTSSQGATVELAHFNADSYGDASGALSRDGVIIIDNLLSRIRIAELYDALQKEYPAYLTGESLDDCYVVGERRFVAPLRFAAPFDSVDILANHALVEVLTEILGADFVYEAFGVTVSLPGAPEQARHRDGGVLFGETGLDQILPSSAVTIAVPLIDMGGTHGSTTFWPRTHRFREAAEHVIPVSPMIQTGSLAIWDFRIEHAGGANQGKIARPFLYLTACRPFWIDHKNFVKGKNAKLLASSQALSKLDETMQQRFKRADILED